MKTFFNSLNQLNWPVHFLIPALCTLSFIFITPGYALSQERHEHSNSKTVTSGSEYKINEKPMEHHHQSDVGGDLFRTRGSHGES